MELKLQNPKKLLFVINVDWYFMLHWVSRIKALKNDGYEVVVCTGASSESLTNEIESMGIKVFSLPLKRNGNVGICSFVSTLFKLVYIGLSERPSVAHFVTIKPILAGSLMSPFLSFASIYSFAGMGVLRAKKKAMLATLIKFLLTSLWRISPKRPAILFEHEDDKEFIIGGSNNKNLMAKVIPGAGVNPKAFPYSEEEGFNEFRVFFGARLLKSKGLEDLVAAGKGLVRKGIPIKVVVAGIADCSHPDALTSDDLENLKNASFVEWLGKKNDIAYYIEKSNVVCLPTKYGEGIPRILIEASSVGRAVVAGDVEGCRSFVKNGVSGFLISNADELMQALEFLYENPDKRKEFANRLREDFLLKYTESAVIERTKDVYRDFHKA